MKWTSSRSEAFVTDAQGRDHVTKIELALDKDGKFLAFRTETLANLGAYLRLFAHGDADLPARPGGRRAVPDAARLRERQGGLHQHRAGRRLSRRRAAGGRPTSSSGVVDKAAREMGIDPVEIRRKNFVKPDEFPYQTPLAVVYDTRQLPRDPRQAPGDLRLRRLPGAAGEAARRGAGCAASASRPGSRPAASRRRSSIGALGARAGLYEARRCG